MITACAEGAILIVDETGFVAVPDLTGEIAATDNCAVGVTQSPTAGSLIATGDTTVMFTASDGTELPPGTNACFAAQVLDPCP